MVYDPYENSLASGNFGSLDTMTADSLTKDYLQPEPTTNTSIYDESSAIQAEAEAYLNEARKSQTQSKYERLNVAAANKREKLRKDPIDYGDDSDFIESAKMFANEFLPHDWQLAVNRNGKRYTTQNKIFNNEDLSNAWQNIQEDPQGDKSLYYLKKLDGYNEDGSEKWLYKAGIAHVSAADRYKSQLANSEWQLIGEKRFNEASTLERKIHGNEEFLKYRAFDYGRSVDDKYKAQEQGLAFNDFGAGKSELYTKDILGADTGTKEEYKANQLKSKEAMINAMRNYTGREDTFEFVDAFQSASVKLAGKAIKLVGENLSDAEGDGAIEAWGKKLIKDADKIVGYNSKSLQTGTHNIRKGIQDMQEGNVGRGIVSIIDGMIDAGPQVVAGSLPETLAVGVGAAAGPVGFLAGAMAVGAMNANDTLDEREKLNNGRKATTKEILGVTLGETFAAGIDYGVFRFVGLGKLLPKGADKPIDLLTKLKDPTIKADIGKALYRGMIAGGAEAGQEATTEAIRTLGREYATEKYANEDFIDVLNRNKEEIAVASVLGASGGTIMNAPLNLATTVSDMTSTLNIRKERKDFIDAGKYISSLEDKETKQIFAEMDKEQIKATHENLVNVYNTLEKANSQAEFLQNFRTLQESLNNIQRDTGIPVEIMAHINKALTAEDLSTGKFNEVKTAILNTISKGTEVLNRSNSNLDLTLDSLDQANIEPETGIVDGGVATEVDDTTGEVYTTKTEPVNVDLTTQQVDQVKQDVAQTRQENKPGIVKAFMSKLTGLGEDTKATARDRITSRLEKLTPKALEKLKTEIPSLVQSTVGKDGYNIIDENWVSNTISNIESKRGQSNVTLGIGKTEQAKALTGLELGKLLSTIESVTEPKEKDAIKTRFIEELSVRPVPELRMFFNDVLGKQDSNEPNLGTVAEKLGVFKGDKHYGMLKNVFNKVAKYTEGSNATVAQRRAFILNTAKASVALGSEDVNTAKRFLNELKAEGKVSDTQFGKLTSMLDRVQKNSEQVIKQQEEVIIQETEANINKMEEAETASPEFIKAMKDNPDLARTVMNYGGTDTTRRLEEAGLTPEDIKEVVKTKTIIIDIC